jgi:hypothetical protein
VRSTGLPRRILAASHRWDSEKQEYYRFSDQMHGMCQRAGVLSLSSINDDILMWAHYANCHRGLCIEYSRATDNILGREAKVVRYHQTRPSVTPDDLNRNLQAGLETLLLVKSEHWQYEMEWRVIHHKGGEAHPLDAPVVSIIFGMKMPEADRVAIAECLKGRGIRFQKAVERPYKFAIDIQDWSAE